MTDFQVGVDEIASGPLYEDLGFHDSFAAGRRTLSVPKYPQPRRRSSLAKGSLDIMGGVVILLLALPVLLIIGLAIFLTDRGPIFYRQSRIGCGGRSFDVIKFRTMHPNADGLLAELLANNNSAKLEWEIQHKLANDPRVTKVGSILRRFSLDELPQIWNIIRGDMSLVGPRPIVREEIPKYGRYIEHYFAVLPGLTGLWQVHGRGNEVSYRRRVAMDCWYISHRSFFLDCQIIYRTTGVVLAGKGT